MERIELDRIPWLTIYEPWASLVVDGIKRVENRGRSTAQRGWIGIHAGRETKHIPPSDLPRYTLGAMIGVAHLVWIVDVKLCQPGSHPPGLDWVWTHPYLEGPKGWVFDRAVRLPVAIPCRGGQALWKPDHKIVTGRYVDVATSTAMAS